MTEQNKLPRPSRVTTAGWVAVAGSAFLVLTMFESVSQLRTVESRDSIEQFLSTPPGDGLGLHLSQAVELLRGLMFFTSAVAAAATVLAVFVLQRHNPARVGFTIAAAALVLTAPVGGVVLPVVIAVAAVMLWTQPARDWFDGVPATARSGSVAVFAAPDPRSRVEGTLLSENTPSQEEPESPGGGRPAEGQAGEPSYPQAGYPPPPPYAAAPYGQPYGQTQPHGGQPYGQTQQPYGQPPYGQQQPPYGQPPYGQQQPYPPPYFAGPQRPRDPDQRPTNVTIAAWITWAVSALSLVGLLVVGIALSVGGQDLIRQVAQDPAYRDQLQNIPTRQLIAALWVLVAAGLFWGLCAMVLAWFAFRRANWARVTLVVSAAITALFSLAAFPASILQIIGAVAVIALLFTGGANEWYSRRPAPGSMPAGFPGPFQPYGQQYGGQPGQPYGGSAQQYGGPPTQPEPRYGGRPSTEGQPTQPGQPEQPRQAGEAQQPGQAGEPAQPGPPPYGDRARERGKDEPPSNVW